MKPRLLDLFCGAGGAAKGYQRAGFYVVGVDIQPQPNYCGDEFVQDDALVQLAFQGCREVPRWVAQYDAIHASPPCQAYSTLKARTRHIAHPGLVPATRELLRDTGLPYVIENVVGAPLVEPITLCGSAFGLGVRRHRLFECNFPVMSPGCAHGQQPPRFDVYEHGRWFKSTVARVYGHGGGKANEHWPAAMDIDWMTHSELAQAIPPAMTEHVGGYLMAEVEARKAVAA